MNQMTVSLPDELDSLIKSNVKSGAYASNSEVVCEAIRLWRDHDNDHELRLEAIKSRIHASIHDPRPRLSSDEVKARLDDYFSTFEVKGDAEV